MISIRVSDTEYDLVKSHYAALGGRSVSAFARQALQVVLRKPVTEQTQSDPANEVRQLADKLKVLEGEVSLLTRIVSERLAVKS